MHKLIICFISLNVFYTIALQTQYPCNLRETLYGYVCVCNATYCDTLDVSEPTKRGDYVIVTSSRNKERFSYDTGAFREKSQFKLVPVLKIDSDKRYQKIEGFGGGYTGSVAHLVDRLPPKLRHCLFKSYFSNDIGMKYGYLRVPIGGTDFDLSPWAYNEHPENDVHLSNFTQLDKRDITRNAQLKELAQVCKNKNVKILAVNWGPPPWMKMKRHWNGGLDNQLKREYYQTWADYHLKWLQLMDKDGIPIWALSTGNEPASAAQIQFQSLSWNASDQAVWVADHLGPAIRNSKYSNIEIHGFDDNRDLAPNWVNEMESYKNGKALEYFKALEFHAYADKALEPGVLDYFQNKYRDKQIWYTEMCFGAFFMTKFTGPRLGAWSRFQSLTYILMENLSHSTVGYIDWNLVLNHYGGPSYFNNQVDAQVIINKEFTELYKEPTFYAMAHFSRFIPNGSIRIEAKLSISDPKLKYIAFLRPDNKIVVIVYNAMITPKRLVIQDKVLGSIDLKLEPKSLITLVYCL